MLSVLYLAHFPQLLLEALNTLIKLLKITRQQGLSNKLKDIDVFMKSRGLFDPEDEAIFIWVKIFNNFFLIILICVYLFFDCSYLLLGYR
jgi:hypothetical protein